MSVKSLCTREVDTATMDESALVAAEKMHQRSVGALVVVNRSNQALGIVTDRDLAMRVVAKGLSPSETLVAEVMTATPTTVTESCSIERALFEMGKGKFRRLPVVDRTERVTGLVTLDDILMQLATGLHEVGHILRSETPPAIADQLQFSDTSRFQNESRLSVGD